MAKKTDDNIPKAILNHAAKVIVKQVLDGKTVKELHRELHSPAAKREVLFLKAEIAYLTDSQMRSVESFYGIMEGLLTLHEFVNRATTRKWVVSREHTRQHAQADLVHRVGQTIVREQMEEAKEFKRVRGWLFELIQPERNEEGKLEFQVSPNSLEGIIKAWKDMSMLLQVYRQEVLQQLEPMVDEPPHMAEGGPFSESEAGAIARAILRRRCDQGQLIEADLDSDSDDEET